MHFRLDHGLLSSESEEEDCNDDMEEEHDIEPYPCIKVVTTNAEVNELLSDRPVPGTWMLFFPLPEQMSIMFVA